MGEKGTAAKSHYSQTAKAVQWLPYNTASPQLPGIEFLWVLSKASLGRKRALCTALTTATRARWTGVSSARPMMSVVKESNTVSK